MLGETRDRISLESRDRLSLLGATCLPVGFRAGVSGAVGEWPNHSSAKGSTPVQIWSAPQWWDGATRVWERSCQSQRKQKQPSRQLGLSLRNVGVAKWYRISLPTKSRRFNPGHPHHVSIVKRLSCRPSKSKSGVRISVLTPRASKMVLRQPPCGFRGV